MGGEWDRGVGGGRERFLVSHFNPSPPATSPKALSSRMKAPIFCFSPKSNLNIKLHVAIKTLLGGGTNKKEGAVHSITRVIFFFVAGVRRGGEEGVMDEISEMVPGGMEQGGGCWGFFFPF